MFNVFPNPFQQEITIQSVGKIYSIQLFSLDGRLIFESIDLETNSQVLHLPELENGIYNLVINQTIVKQINK